MKIIYVLLLSLAFLVIGTRAFAVEKAAANKPICDYAHNRCKGKSAFMENRDPYHPGGIVEVDIKFSDAKSVHVNPSYGGYHFCLNGGAQFCGDQPIYVSVDLQTVSFEGGCQNGLCAGQLALYLNQYGLKDGKGVATASVKDVIGTGGSGIILGSHSDYEYTHRYGGYFASNGHDLASASGCFKQGRRVFCVGDVVQKTSETNNSAETYLIMGYNKKLKTVVLDDYLEKNKNSGRQKIFLDDTEVYVRGQDDLIGFQKTEHKENAFAFIY